MNLKNNMNKIQDIRKKEIGRSQGDMVIVGIVFISLTIAMIVLK